MLKKFIPFLLLTLFLLTGCAVDKVVSVPKGNPAVLFMQTVSIIKQKLPSARTEVDVLAKKLTISPNNIDYPASVCLTFTKNEANADISIISEEASELQVANLQKLLIDAFIIKNKNPNS